MGGLTGQGLEPRGSQSGVQWKTTPPRAPGWRPAGPSAAPDTRHGVPKNSPAGTPGNASSSEGTLTEGHTEGGREGAGEDPPPLPGAWPLLSQVSVTPQRY